MSKANSSFKNQAIFQYHASPINKMSVNISVTAVATLHGLDGALVDHCASGSLDGSRIGSMGTGQFNNPLVGKIIGQCQVCRMAVNPLDSQYSFRGVLNAAVENSAALHMQD